MVEQAWNYSVLILNRENDVTRLGHRLTSARNSLLRMWVAGAIVGGGEKPRGKCRSILGFWTSTAPLPVVEDACATELEERNSRAALRRSFLSIATQISIFEIMYWILLLSAAVAVQASLYLPPPMKEEQLLEDAFLRELINQMGNDLVDSADSYLEYQDKPKEIPLELPADYDAMDALGPNPSIRDQEYLRHSTLWSHQRVNNNDEANDRQMKPGNIKYIKDEKTENSLPAYCTPPNPCPVGYTSENNCIMDFENTAAFSRDYQSAQDCMCDTEHMMNCPIDSTNGNSLPSMHIPNSNLNEIVDQFQAEENPFFRGEKLPIAAKKGLNVVY